MKLLLTSFSTGEITIGKLYSEKEFICYTVERPWLENKVNVSCIPDGEYILKRVDSPKFGDTFEVTNVIGRTHILFHKANFVSELQGCIAPASSIDVIRGELGGFSSGDAYNKLMGLLEGDKHKLVIERY